jgi:hypothetical protein
MDTTTASWVRFALALGVLAAAWGHARGGTVSVLEVGAGAARAPAPSDSRLEADFQGLLTADDVARGVQALERGDTGAPALTEAQRARLAPLVASGRDARKEVDRLRAERRAGRERLRDAGLALLAVAER